MAIRKAAAGMGEVHQRSGQSSPTLRKARSRVLVVEDHDDTREAVGMLLKTEGYDVVLAADGEAGMASARTSRPDVAIVDIFLPGKDGVVVIEELCRDLPSATIIAVSADTSADRQGALSRARKAGAHLTLRKPLEPWVLLKTIAEALGKSA
jgi:DNA-binding response OmpR family regulator